RAKRLSAIGIPKVTALLTDSRQVRRAEYRVARARHHVGSMLVRPQEQQIGKRRGNHVPGRTTNPARSMRAKRFSCGAIASVTNLARLSRRTTAQCVAGPGF